MAVRKKAEAVRRDVAAINARVSQEEYALVERAAGLERRTISNFVALAAIKAAKQALREHGEDVQ